MPSKVLAFSARGEGLSEIPTPIYYQQGDEYVRVNVTGNAAEDVGLYPGAVVVFLRNFRQDGGLHLLTLGGGEQFISRVESRGRLVRFGPHLSKAEWISAGEVDVYGALAELWPTGLDGPRSITHRPDRARIMAPASTSYGAEYRLAAL